MKNARYTTQIFCNCQSPHGRRKNTHKIEGLDQYARIVVMSYLFGTIIVELFAILKVQMLHM